MNFLNLPKSAQRFSHAVHRWTDRGIVYLPWIMLRFFEIPIITHSKKTLYGQTTFSINNPTLYEETENKIKTNFLKISKYSIYPYRVNNAAFKLTRDAGRCRVDIDYIFTLVISTLQVGLRIYGFVFFFFTLYNNTNDGE